MVDVANIRSSGGTILEISETMPTAYTSTAYAAISTGWTPVGGITSIGDIVKAYTDVAVNLLADRDTLHLKGTRDIAALELAIARDYEDAGLELLMQYLDSDNSLTGRVTTQDGTKIYFTFKVFSVAANISDANTVTGANTSIQPYSGSFIMVNPV